jgi:VanZ family protein
MTIQPRTAIQTWILSSICLFLLGGILVAGLWPFHHPQNKVNWLPGGNGLRFGARGTIVSANPFPAPDSSAGASCSLEIWLQPRFVPASNTFLAFSTLERPRQFALRQSLSDLAVYRGGRSRPTKLYVDEFFHGGEAIFVTITSSGQQMVVYANGSLVRRYPQFQLSSRDFTGELIVGDAPVQNSSWSGDLRGLALYQQELTPTQVMRHYETWTKTGRPEILPAERAMAVYLLDEHAGRVAHNLVNPATDLSIPERYKVVRQVLLESPWLAFSPTRGYVDDVVINIGGFIPLGFFFCAYLTLVRRVDRAAVVTILLGAAISLTIESLQSFLPTRDSDMTDVITNILGTCLGVLLYRSKVVQALVQDLIRRGNEQSPR